MNKKETEVFEKAIDTLEYDLKDKFVNIYIVEYDTENMKVVVGFNHNDRFAGNDVSVVKYSYYEADMLWANVDEILNVNDLIKYIRENKLVETWNAQIIDNEAQDLINEVQDYIKDFLTSGAYNDVVNELDLIEYENYDDEESNETADVDEILSTLEDMKVVVKYDNREFWTEEDLIEEWKANFAE